MQTLTKYLLPFNTPPLSIQSSFRGRSHHLAEPARVEARAGGPLRSHPESCLRIMLHVMQTKTPIHKHLRDRQANGSCVNPI